MTRDTSESSDRRSDASENDTTTTSTPDRRNFLKVAGSAAGVLLLSGCGAESANSTPDSATQTTSTMSTPTPSSTSTTSSQSTTSNTTEGTPSAEAPKTYTEDELFKLDEWRGSGPLIEDRPSQFTGISMLDLPDLRGELTVYLGGGEGGLYANLMKRIQYAYRDFTVNIRKAPSSQLANTIIEETTAGSSPADIFWSIDAGSVGIVANNDATVELPDRVVRSIPDTFHPTDQWIGVMGRARSIPFNTDELDTGGVPSDIFAFAEDPGFDRPMGWAPTYGAFQAFVTAMRLLNSREEAKAWLNGMQEQGIRTYDNELVVANAVANGELSAGFSNHYYSRLVFEERPDAPLDLAFTKNDAGSLINCSAAEIVKGTRNEELAADFIHHLVSIEAQVFLTTRGYEYPLLPSVPPVGSLPTIDQLNPPEFNLSKLADLEPTLQLLREVGAL